MNMLEVLKRRLIETRHSRRKRISALVTVDSLEVRLLLTAPTMTDSEQYMLELINRARANPTVEVARFGIGLNDGLAAGTITTAAKQPLAPQQQLITAAGLHSQDMLDRDYFSHTTLGVGTTFSQRVTNQGYIWSLVAENIGYAAKTINASQTAYIDEVHEGLDVLAIGQADAFFALLQPRHIFGQIAFDAGFPLHFFGMNQAAADIRIERRFANAQLGNRFIRSQIRVDVHSIY